MGVEHLLDVSALPAPEPLEVVLDALGHLDEGDYLRVLHRREPWPLFPILEERGFAYRLQPGQRSAFEILIWRKADADAEALASSGGPTG